MASLPDLHGLIVMLLTLGALVLFSRDRLPLETSCLTILVLLVLLFQFFPYAPQGVPLAPADFLTGFGHEALITICALMIVGKGLETTGALKPLAVALSQGWQRNPVMSLLLTLTLGALLSAFVNNTPIVVMLLPILVSVSIQTRKPASGVLMPMGLATLLGGMATTIGTSTNLLVVSIAQDLGQPRMGMFDFTLPALIAGTVGVIYLWQVAPRLLPERQALLSDTSPRVFTALLHVSEDSFANGRTLAEVRKRTEDNIKIERIQRGENLYLTRLPSVQITAGDRLVVNDTPERLKEFERVLGTRLHSADDPEQPITGDEQLAAVGQQLAEVVVTRGSPLHHRTLRRTRFSTRYRLMPLAIHRAKGDPTGNSELRDVRLRAGDVILVQGTRDAINELKRSNDMLVLDGTTDLPYTERARWALGIMLAVIGSAALDIMPISISSISGVALMILTGCLTWRDLSSALSAPVILVIVVSLALGSALMATGGAAFLADSYVGLTQNLPIPIVMSGLMLLMAVITNVVSNNAAAVIGTPIAIGIAQSLGAPIQPFVLAVLFGANMSYATPIGYQTNLLVLSAGGYKFSDFLRVGVPLTLIIWLTLSVVLTLFYGL
ncbi:MAG: SLC13 family permease [Pseudomonadota bacterium]